MSIPLRSFLGLCLIVSYGTPGPRLGATICLNPEPCASIAYYAAVFAGTVEKLKEGQDHRAPIVVFSVDQSFGGPPQPGDLVEVRWWSGERLQKGDELLVYAYRDEESGVYETPSLCGESVSVIDAEKDLEFLRKQKRGETPTTLRGSACLSKGVDCVDLPGVEIRLLGKTFEQTVLTDAYGHFEFTDLPPGRYVGKVVKKDYIPSRDPYEFEVYKGACNRFPAAMAPDTQVSGTVVDVWGLPAGGIKVQIYDGDTSVTKDHPFPIEVVTDSAGKFSFRGIQPGQYRVGVNIDLREAPSPFAKTYFPGVSNESEARVIKLGWGQHIDGIDFQLPLPLKKRNLDVRVVWPDGTPAVGAHLAFDYGRGKCQYFQPVSHARADVDGRISTEIFREGCYHFYGGLVEFWAETRVGESDWSEIPPGDEPVAVELVLKPPR